VPGVIDELDDFLIFLGLEEDAAVGHLHGLERQIGYAGPGKDQIARLPPPRNSPQLYHGETLTLAGNLRFAREAPGMGLVALPDLCQTRRDFLLLPSEGVWAQIPQLRF